MAEVDLSVGYAADLGEWLPELGIDCLPRDIVMRNDELAVVIGGGGRGAVRDFSSFFAPVRSFVGVPIVLLPSGGRNYLSCLLTGVAKEGKKPISPPSYEEARILRDRPEVVVEAHGKNLEDKLELITKFELKPSRKHLLISTKIINTSDEELSLDVGDVLRTTSDMYGFSQFTGPVRGLMNNHASSSEKWFATRTRRRTLPPASYSEYFPEETTMSIVDIWGAEVYAKLNLKLAPREDHVYHRSLLAASTSNVEKLYKLIHKEILHKKAAFGLVKGKVLDVRGREVLDMHLTVKRGEETLHKTNFTHIKFRLRPPMARRSGVFSLFLPTSRYTFEVRHQNATITKKLNVLGEKITRVTFDQRPLAGYVTGKVRETKGGPIICRIDVFREDRFFSSSFSDKKGVYRIPVPPGKWKVAVSRGFEYSRATSEMETKTGKRTVFDSSLERVLDYRKFGWFAGDQHLHSTYMDGLDTPHEIAAAAEGTGLDWIFLSDYPSAAMSLPNRRASGVLVLPAQEFSNKYGHFNALGITRRIRSSLRLDTFLQKVHENEGLAIINHPYQRGYFWYLDNFGGSLEEFDGVEVWNGGRGPLPDERAMRKWYSYLNEGKRLVAVASSDAHGVDNVGFPRTYVRVKGMLTASGIIEAERNLHAFCTNGPLIRFGVNGKGPGEVLTGAKGKVHVRISVDSVFPVSGVRLIKNGEEVLNTKLKDSYRGKMSWDMKVDGPCWLSAQVYGVERMKNSRPTDAPPFAFTNPVFINAPRENGSTRNPKAALLLGRQSRLS